MTLRPRRSTFPEALGVAAVVAAAMATPRASSAQACCAGASALTPGRLLAREDALVGAQVRSTVLRGAWDGAGAWVPSPHGDREVDLELDLVGALRFARRGQVSLTAPWVETWRTVPGRGEHGGGLGDVQVAGRWDLTLPGEVAWVPGLALLAGGVAPTGRAPDDARLALAADATGTGAWQGSVGVSVEQILGKGLVSGAATLSVPASREVGGTSTRTAPEWLLFGAAGYTLAWETVLAATAAYTTRGDATLDGARVPGTAQHRLRLGVGVGTSLGWTWRVQGALFGDVPASGLGRNDTGGVGASALVARTWG